MYFLLFFSKWNSKLDFDEVVKGLNQLESFLDCQVNFCLIERFEDFFPFLLSEKTFVWVDVLQQCLSDFLITLEEVLVLDEKLIGLCGVVSFLKFYSLHWTINLIAFVVVFFVRIYFARS